MLTNDKNEKFIPAFTDQDELVKNTVQPRHQVAVLTVRDFAMVFSQNPICKGFVINPFGDNMCLTREQLENLFQHARQVPRQQDGKVLVGGAPSLSSQVDMAMNNLKKEKEMELTSVLPRRLRQERLPRQRNPKISPRFSRRSIRFLRLKSPRS